MIRKIIEVVFYKCYNEIVDEHGDWHKEYTGTTADPEEANNSDMFVTKKTTFTTFTNSGKLSKTEDYFFQCVKEEAERLFKEAVDLEEATESAMARGIELKNIVNKAFDEACEEDFTLLDIKTSRSKWYDRDDVFNQRSQYEKYVPTCVLGEAHELQELRRANHGNNKFSFEDTNYKCIVKRVADHENYGI